MIYFCDHVSTRIRRFENGIISELPFTFELITGLAIDNNGDILVIDNRLWSVYKIDVNNERVAILSNIILPRGGLVCIDDMFYVSDYHGTIFSVSGGECRQFAENTDSISCLCDGLNDSLLLLNHDKKYIKKINTNGKISTFINLRKNEENNIPFFDMSSLSPRSLTIDQTFIYMTDPINHVVVRIKHYMIWNKGKG